MKSNQIKLNYLFSFFILTIINQGSFLSTYTFKSSSYIWSIGFLYLGILIFKDISVSRRIPYLIGIYLIYLYIYAVLDFPQSVMDFFLSISDKYEPHKGSDILIMTLVPLYFVLKYFGVDYMKKLTLIMIILNLILAMDLQG